MVMYPMGLEPRKPALARQVAIYPTRSDPTRHTDRRGHTQQYHDLMSLLKGKYATITELEAIASQ